LQQLTVLGGHILLPQPTGSYFGDEGFAWHWKTIWM